MAAQPANTDIQVFQSLRSYRQALRNDSIAALIKRLRPLVMSIPAQEVLVGVLSRDSSVQDFSPYMGEARHSADRGFPVVVGLKEVVTFQDAQNNLPEIDFAFQIGSDKFLRNTDAGKTRDLHRDARDLNAV
jgi:hypothetical protein